MERKTGKKDEAEAEKVSIFGSMMWTIIGIFATVFIVSALINLVVNYNGYEYTYMGPWYNESLERHTPFDEIQAQCADICGDLPAMSYCPCDHCGCWCVKHEYFGITREVIRKQCEVY